MDPGEGPGGPPRLFILFLDQTEARSAEKSFLRPPLPPYLRVWMTAPPRPLFEGLYPPVPPRVYSHFSVSLVCQKQAVHPGLVDVQALLGQKTTSQPTGEFKTANR